MTTLSDAQKPHGSGVEPLRAKCGSIVALGVVYVLAGLIALSSVALARDELQGVSIVAS